MRIIAGLRKGTRLQFPADKNTRPLTDRIKESLFGYLGGTVIDARVLDLYAGCGSFGIEALSREAVYVKFVETGREALHSLQLNLKAAGFTERAEISRGDVAASLRREVPRGEGYRIVFFDPPFEAVISGAFSLLLAAAAEDVRRITAAESLVIIRIPTRVETIAGPPGFDHLRTKVYGRSTVIIYRKQMDEIPGSDPA